jgi:hypothetical protein
MVTTVTRDGGNENGRQVVVEATWRPKGQREVNSTRRFRRLQDFATKKNGEVLKTSLMIPKCAELPANFAISIQQQLSTIDDINAIEDGRRRLLALQTYFTKKENKQEVEIAARWCEVRIGELLGPAEQTHPGKKASHAREVLPKNDRHNFRLMAQNKKIVERLGEVLAATVSHEGSRGQLKGNTVLPQATTLPTKISKMQSSRSQALAKIPWSEIEEKIQECTVQGKKIKPASPLWSSGTRVCQSCPQN